MSRHNSILDMSFIDFGQNQKRSRAAYSQSDVSVAIERGDWDTVVKYLDGGVDFERESGLLIQRAMCLTAPLYVIKKLIDAGAELTCGQSRRMAQPVFAADTRAGIYPLKGYKAAERYKVLKMLIDANAPTRWLGNANNEFASIFSAQGSNEWRRNPREFVRTVRMLVGSGLMITDAMIRSVYNYEDLQKFKAAEEMEDQADAWLPLLIGTQKRGEGELGKVANHPLYTRDVLRAVMRLSKQK